MATVIDAPEGIVTAKKSRLAMAAGIVCVLVGLVGMPGASEAEWMLMARHGGCVGLPAAAKRLETLQGVSEPGELAAKLRRQGVAVQTTETAVPGGRVIELTAPTRGLAMVFVPRELCRSLAPGKGGR